LPNVDLLALDEALTKLAAEEPLKAHTYGALPLIRLCPDWPQDPYGLKDDSGFQ
jgi:hypothetical protein